MAGLTISELALAGGASVETVRFYQRRGLLHDPRPSRNGGAAGRRHYGGDDVRRLSFIRMAKSAGFTLDDIGTLLELDRTRDRARARNMASARLIELDRRISELEAARAALARLASACAAEETGPCPIIAAFTGDAG